MQNVRSLKGSDILAIAILAPNLQYYDDGMIGMYIGVRPGVHPGALPAPLRLGVDIMNPQWVIKEEDAAIKLVEEMPVLAYLLSFSNQPCLIEVAAAHNLFRLCELLVKINPRSVYAWNHTYKYPIHRAAASLSIECCRILIGAARHWNDPSIVDACVRSSRFGIDSIRFKECLWTLIDYGRCPVSEKTIHGSENVRCVMWARVHARDAAMVMAGISRLSSPVLGKYNGRDVTRLISLAVWMTRRQWLDVETERCKRHRQEHPNMPYGI